MIYDIKNTIIKKISIAKEPFLVFIHLFFKEIIFKTLRIKTIINQIWVF